MGTPLSWLERMPTYKDQDEKLKDRDLAYHGFLGYPLQAADIPDVQGRLRAGGEDQAPHVEITREVARRFNHPYGRAFNHDELVAAALAKRDGTMQCRYVEKQRKAYGPGRLGRGAGPGEPLVKKARRRHHRQRHRRAAAGPLEGAAARGVLIDGGATTETSKLPGLDGELPRQELQIPSRHACEEPAEVEGKGQAHAHRPRSQVAH